MGRLHAPDLILHRGRIVTGKSGPPATAAAIRNGVFSAVGLDAQILPFAGPITRVIDLAGHLLLPGLVDNHLDLIGHDASNTARPARTGMKQSFAHRRLTARLVLRDLNRLGVTSALDPGGLAGDPDQMRVARRLADDRQLTVRIGYSLSARTPGQEHADFLRWTRSNACGEGGEDLRLIGGGGRLVFSADDGDDLCRLSPDWPPAAEVELEAVVRVLAERRWPWRMRATHDRTIARALDVFERVDQDLPLTALHWFFDGAELVSDRSMDRIAALGGGIAIQSRMAYWGEDVVARYGAAVVEAAPPVATMMANGLPVSAGTTGSAETANPWVSLAWLVTGQTVRGLQLYPRHNCLSREAALRLWTENTAWFTDDVGRKGRIEVGHLADLMVPDRDYFACPDGEITSITSLLTLVGGEVVHAAGPFAAFVDDPLPPSPPK